MTKKYLINKLTSELTLKAGYLNVAPLSFSIVHEHMLGDESIKYAVAQDWLEVSDTEPEAAPVKQEVEVEIAQPYQGLTAEELKAEQAKKAAEKAAQAEAEAEGEDQTTTEAEQGEQAAPATRTRKSK